MQSTIESQFIMRKKVQNKNKENSYFLLTEIKHSTDNIKKL